MDQLRLIPRKPQISELMLGGAGLAGMFHVVPHDQAIQTLQKAVELGITQFDTAPWYGAGKSEEYFGEVLTNPNLDIYTKVGRVIKNKADCDPNDARVAWNLIPDEFKLDGNPTDNIPVHDYSREGALLSFQQSQARMPQSHIKCLRLHDAENHGEDQQKQYYDWATSPGGAMETLIELKSQGKVDEISLGMNSPHFLLRFLRHYPEKTFDNLMMAGSWNLLDLTGVEVLKECQSRGIKVTLAGVFGGGMLWGENVLRYRPAQQEDVDRRERWKQLCHARGCSLQAAALHFSFLPACVSSVCIGALSAENVVTNLALCDETVPLELWEDAKKEGLLPEWFSIQSQ